MTSTLYLIMSAISFASWGDPILTHGNEATVISQELIGAWETKMTNDNGAEITSVMIITDQYISVATYSVDNQEFIGTSGGAWTVAGDTIQMIIEYNTDDPDDVGKIHSKVCKMKQNMLFFESENLSWSRIDFGTPGALSGSWLITGRKRNGEISTRVPGARKTMKILSGTRFQWIAYNTDSGAFFGTGGGTYTTQNGKYTENIAFFSRDSSRVGATLEFDYTLELEKGEWHHSGFSSKGAPIYEIWTLRSELNK